ncbi:cell division protein FtsN [Budviciaceae bacterium BWR-B9]|uniref:Cell division protein FtsN n=1 Tax=Limnobaculum allomyrinae TaxID=2791986 RepID=A0ABS1IVD2_9GAMM|nr:MULTISPECIES: cell division protein FtsN [Limnobaculum]MBK5145639.1 cell division protein FtsN [Limnobaculum allomyrinae]MBV7692584.1 cell division protein FtsN [Limnobaculum sp. M2-1]
MAQRDYVSRSRSGTRSKKNSRKKKSSSGGASKLMIVLALAVLVVFGGGLYYITQHKPETVPAAGTPAVQPGNGLPPKPEERWSYIKELENRQVTNSPNSTGQPKTNTQAPLTAEQKRMLDQIQADMQKPPIQLSGVDASGRPSTARDGGTKPALNNTAAVNTQTQQQTPTPTPPKKVTPPAPAPVTSTPKTTSQTAAQAQSQRWIIQCGSFKALDQAESVKVNLAFSGIESRISTSDGWNRVILGPYNNREAADKTLQRLKSSGMSGCIPVASGK